MRKVITPAGLYYIEYYCDSCNTKMVLDNCLPSYPAKYTIKCPKCGASEIITEEQLPGIHSAKLKIV